MQRKGLLAKEDRGKVFGKTLERCGIQGAQAWPFSMHIIFMKDFL